MSNNPKTISEETNLLKIGNLIKIPNYDLIEETNNHPPFYIDGFSVIEINEENKDLFQFEDIPDIETKNDFLLKKKANIVTKDLEKARGAVINTSLKRINARKVKR